MKFLDFLNKRLNAIAKERALITVKAKYDGKCMVTSILRELDIEVKLMSANPEKNINIVDEIKQTFKAETTTELEKIYVKLLVFFKDVIKEEKDV